MLQLNLSQRITFNGLNVVTDTSTHNQANINIHSYNSYVGTGTFINRAYMHEVQLNRTWIIYNNFVHKLQVNSIGDILEVVVIYSNVSLQWIIIDDGVWYVTLLRRTKDIHFISKRTASIELEEQNIDQLQGPGEGDSMNIFVVFHQESCWLAVQDQRK
jgi:hypothetical protein